MIIANFVTNRSTMGETATYADYMKTFGDRPHKLGIMAKLYPELTASFITESLFNVYSKSAKPNKFNSIDTLLYDQKS